MNELIEVTLNDNHEPVISGRQLHEALGVKTEYRKWFGRMSEYGFEEIKDLIEYIEKLDGNILVTLGSNNVPLFRGLKNLSNIYFRILSKTIRDYILCSVLEIISFCVVLSSVTN